MSSCSLPIWLRRAIMGWLMWPPLSLELISEQSEPSRSSLLRASRGLVSTPRCCRNGGPIRRSLKDSSASRTRNLTLNKANLPATNRSTVLGGVHDRENVNDWAFALSFNANCKDTSSIFVVLSMPLGTKRSSKLKETIDSSLPSSVLAIPVMDSEMSMTVTSREGAGDSFAVCARRPVTLLSKKSLS